MGNPTFVTMFFDLARFEGIERRNHEKYLKDAEYLLSQNIYLIIFTEPDMAKSIYEMRERYNLIHKTKIYTMPIGNLPYFHLLEKIKEARTINPMINGSPTKDTPIYNVLIWSKIAFMKQIVDINPFNSEFFAWIDFGISYVAITKDVDFSSFNMPSTIKLLTLRPIFYDDISPTPFDFSSHTSNQNISLTQGEHMKNINQNHIMKKIDLKHFYSCERGLVAFGFVTGSNQAWRLLHTLFDKEVHTLLEQNLAPSEQQILPILMIQNPSLFETYRGDYNGILCNYNKFTRSIENVLLYTMCRARNVNQLEAAYNIGKNIFQQLTAGSYDETLENDRYLILIFLNELFYNMVQNTDYTTANDIYMFYTILKQNPLYSHLFQKLPYEFIFD